MHIKKSLVASLLVGSIFSSNTAFAQDEEPAADDNIILVTAQFREQSLNEVPIALTAVDGEFLDQVQVDEFDELSAYIPGFVVQEQSPNNPGFVIRGITSDDGASTIEPRVSVFQNRVSISRSRGSVVPLFDLERIEVLNGPQGTLFGRSAQIGAVNIITAKAAHDPAAGMSLELGNLDHLQADAFANVPLIEDVLAFRIAGFAEERDGFIENNTGGDLNSVSTRAVRGSVLLEPADGIRFDLIANYVENTPSGTSFKSGVIPALGGNTNPNELASLNTFGGFVEGKPLGLERDIFDVTLIGEFAIGGAVTLTTTASYREFDSLEVFDPDGTALDLLIFGEGAQGEQFSADARMVFDDGGPFTAVFGAGYFEEEGRQDVPLGFDLGGLQLFSTFGALPDPATPGADVELPGFVNQLALGALLSGNPAIFAPTGIGQEETVTNFADNTSYDVFGEFSYAFTERLQFTAGLRYTYDQKETRFLAAVTQPNPVIPFVVGSPAVLGGISDGILSSDDQANIDDSFDGLSWRAVLNYELADDAFLYASYARGRRPEVIEEDFARDSGDSDGDGNVAEVAGSFVIVPEETVDSFELGLRGSFADRRLNLQLAAYYYQYKNFQTSVAVNAPGAAPEFDLINAGNADSYGVEAFVNFEATDWLSVFTSYAWNRGRFSETDDNGNVQRFANNRFRLSPDHSLAVGADFEAPISDETAFFFRPNFTWQSEVFFTNENDLAYNVVDPATGGTIFTVPGVSQDSYGLLNASIGVSFFDGQLTVAAFGKNILDEEYIIDGGNTGGVFNIPTFIAGPPARYGIRVSGRY